MNTFFLDCEFNSFGGQLISVALVSADMEAQFYQVLPLNIPEDKIHPWVRANVMPVLFKAPAASILSVQNKLCKFLKENSVNNKINIIADWPDDIRYFNELLITGPGQAIDTPIIIFELNRRDCPDTSKYSVTPHNALEDAKALARGYKGYNYNTI